MLIQLHNISFTYERATNPLFEGVSLSVPPGWTGVVGANGSGKTTFLHLVTERLIPDVGFIQVPGRALYCPQRTDNMPTGFIDFLNAQQKEAYKLRDWLGIVPANTIYYASSDHMSSWWCNAGFGNCADGTGTW